ncbi:MAG: KpsF/GutQ family sugar-phosphate isomerase [Candidatus Omnitrophota bacterium]
MSLAYAKKLILTEAEAVKTLVNKLDKNFLKALDLIAKSKGRLIVAGMGKTGIIGRKIAATLSSTGTPSIFMHSAEAVHGDLGQVTRDDIVIIISTSGETEETTRLAPLLKKIGATTIAVTGNPKSTLAKSCDVILDVGVAREGCPLGVAPMASTTTTLVLGDALAACLIIRKNFRKEDFAFYHPGGSLGRQLYLKVEDIMRKGGNYPLARANTRIKDVLVAITKARCGSACVVDGKGKLIGILTDGDIRRHFEHEDIFLTQKVSEVMTKGPATINQSELAVEAFHLLKERKIDELPVIDDHGKSVGLLDIQDLLRAGLF